MVLIGQPYHMPYIYQITSLCYFLVIFMFACYIVSLVYDIEVHIYSFITHLVERGNGTF